jgi:hypothetical protein
VSLVDSTGASSLEVGRAVVRNRKGFGGFITYDDFAEVLLVDTEVRISHAPTAGFSSILAAIDDALLGTFAHGAPESVDLTAEREGALLTRLVFKRLAIEQRTWTRPLVLSAARARLGFDSRALVLEEGVVLAAPDGTRVRAPRAVLSRDHDGMFLPLGHVYEGVQRRGSAFLVLDVKGRLSATPVIAEISYEDLISQREQLILAHYAERAPPALRPLLLAVLGQLGAPRSP